MKNSPLLSFALTGLLLLTALASCAEAQSEPLDTLTQDWRTDSIWYDGKAECAVYDATRTIYGTLRKAPARIYTNKEPLDPATTTKSASNQGIEAFKHHIRDNFATENYDYHYSTMAYVSTQGLQSLKLDMGSQEDCGASFKQLTNAAALGTGNALQYQQLSYFPEMGHREGQYPVPAGFVFQDALSLVLRGYPFDAPKDITLQVVPDQTNTKWSPVEPVAMTVRYVGRETLDLPVGSVDAHHLRVAPAQGEGAAHDYWFLADASAPAEGPGLHIMVQYEGPEGISYRLRSVERRAYWER